MIARIAEVGLIEGAAIVACAAVCAKVATRNAATRYAIWLVALLALVAMPALTTLVRLHLPVGPPPALAAPAAVTSVAAIVRAGHGAAPWRWSFAIVWAIGMLVLLLRLVVADRRIAAIRARARSSAYAPDVLISDEVRVPLAAGLFSPVVLLPRQLAESLAPEPLELVIAHERAHIARRDIAANVLLRAAQAVLFFNPWVYAVGAALVREREAACDDVVVARMPAADAYAEALVALAARLVSSRDLLLTPSAFGSRRALFARIERLLDPRARRASFSIFAVGGTAMVFAAMTFAIQLLASVPTLGAASSSAEAVSAGRTRGAAACTLPDRPALPKVVQPADFPDSLRNIPVRAGSASVQITLDAEGDVTSAKIAKSSGYPAFDEASIKAALATTYRPARVHCREVAGTYLFHTDFFTH